MSPVRDVAGVTAGILLLAAATMHGQPVRPTVGVAFGGGSARGIAHIGVIQWFEEHHIPIDTAAGTSMGGLIGGAFATGMSGAELRAFMFGAIQASHVSDEVRAGDPGLPALSGAEV